MSQHAGSPYQTQPLRDRLRDARLYLCTDARVEQGDFAEFVDAAYRGGVDIIQLRDKRLEAREELERFAILADAAARHHRLFAANDRADIARLAGAHVLHVGQGDLPIPAARSIVGESTLIGLSTHSPAQAERALRGGADYYCIGPVWPTPTKPGRPGVGVEAVRAVAQQARDAAAHGRDIPWFAIGGINTDTVDEVIAAGATRVVVVRAITQADDPEAAARALSSRLRA